MSFRLKTILGIALIEVVLLTILVMYSMQFLKDSNEAQLMERARTSAQLFATMTTDSVVSMDLATLEEMVSKTLTTPGIQYIRVRHETGIILAEEGDATLLAQPFAPDQEVHQAQSDQSFDIEWPIEVEGTVFGSIELGLDTGTLETLLDDAEEHMLWVAGMEIVLVGVFGFMLGGILTRQLKSLQRGARRVADGELGHSIAVSGRDELADTAQSFNDMSQSLAQYAADLEEARAKAEAKRAQAESVLKDALESLSQGVLIVDGGDQALFVNKAYMNMYGLSPEHFTDTATGETIEQLVAPQVDDAAEGEEAADEMGMTRRKLKNGRSVMPSVRFMSSGGYVCVDTDITSIIEAQEKNRQLEADLMQSQKMESIGRLAGGVAHEINTPIHFVGTNLQFLQEVSEDIFTVIDQYAALTAEAKTKGYALDAMEACEQAVAAADLDFVLEEMPLAIDQAVDGVKRVADIVASMKEFSHPSSKTKAAVDMNRVIERSVAICQSEWKTVAEVEMALAEDLPMVMGSESELNQVVLNLIVNAAQAIAEQPQTKPQALGRIVITTKRMGGQVCLKVADNGPGIGDDIKGQIFDPFFTTKPVGKGTGQGLAIVHDIIVNKHEARIEITDAEPKGAAFLLTFPPHTGQA